MDAAGSVAHVRGARLTHEGGAVAAAAIEALERQDLVLHALVRPTLATRSAVLGRLNPAGPPARAPLAARWCRGALVSWRAGAVARWCRGALVPWRAGARGALVSWRAVGTRASRVHHGPQHDIHLLDAVEE